MPRKQNVKQSSKQNVKQSSKQNVKININLAEKKKPTKSRRKSKAKEKTTYPIPPTQSSSGQFRNPLVTRQDISQPQPPPYPVYVNQYPSSLTTQSPAYMNVGIPSNLGSSRRLTSEVPTTTLSKMNAPTNFQEMYNPIRQSSPLIQQLYEDTNLPYMSREEGNRLRQNFYDPEADEMNFFSKNLREFLEKPRDVDDASSVVSDISSMSGPPSAYSLNIAEMKEDSTMTPASSDLSTLSTGERRRTMINQIGQERIQPNYDIPRWDDEWMQPDDEDDGFFSTESEPPALEEINFA